ncbi:2-hydroxyacyl-CoA dehydratase subunit D [Clostridiisalibacter paucivorans]|uniref:2-hydroxyacyl-CoA dehydratase subunit D n=1 Tax=Clostridiisalibacter paucivorans TaxID=408753 RepID=UPI00047E17F4|nr:2-hydroxyacyl-CoA dehydratase family protein [Clostridiisalibacter paucivorans]
MSNVKDLLKQFDTIVSNPKARLDKYISEGKKVIGCMPVYCPEELVYAADMVPFGVWGSEIEVSQAKKYFPAFICSILQTTLEMGLRGDLDQLSGMMIPVLCDSLKCMGQNWDQGIENVEFIPVIHPQNRKMEAGVEFLRAQYTKIKDKLEQISGNKITDDKLKTAINVYNKHREVMREFVVIAGEHPHLITPSERNAVIKSGYFMDKPAHTKIVQELIDACKEHPKEEWDGLKVVITGIIADSPSILKIFEENKIAIVADDIAHESRQFRTNVPICEDPMESLAKQISVMEGCSVLYDPDKKRGHMIVDEVKKYNADGVIVLMTKFCDPEEYDYPIMKKLFDQNEIPSIMIEIDQQMRNYEQARTMVQTFTDMLGAYC